MSNLPITINPKDNEEESREEKFIRLLAHHPSVRDAAIEAGYSPRYASTGIYTKLKTEKFLAKIRQHYKSYSAALLPKILHAESRIVDIVLESPEKIPKFRHTLKELKQSAGVLEHDNAPRAPVINIEEVQNLMLKME